jgi:phage protein D
MALSTTTTTALSARPQASAVLAPTIELKIEGQAANALQAGLIDCVIEHRRSMPSTCVATFSNWGATAGGVGFLHFGRQLLDFGKAFTVGTDGGVLFHGRIAALAGDFPENAPPCIRVTSEDALAALWERNAFRSFADVTDADVIRRIAADHGLRAQIDLSGPIRAVVSQAGESDLVFLQACLDAAGAYGWIDSAGRLCAARSPGGREAAIVLDAGGNLRDLRMQADVRGQSTRVRARGWNVADKVATSATADAKSVAGEVGPGGTLGTAIRTKAFGAADRFEGTPALVSAAETQAAAAIAFADRARTFVRGIASLGEVRVALPGRRVELRGVGGLFSGIYRIETVTHRFDTTSGWRSSFTVERPWLGAPD